MPPSPQGRSELRALVRLAVPLVILHLGNQLMGAVDTALSGRIDALAQAATGLGNTLFFFGALLGMGITMGIDPLTAQAFGAGRPHAARNILWQGCWVALLIALPVTVGTFWASTGLERIGIAPELAREARRFLNPRLLSITPLLLLTAARSYLQSAHRTGVIVIATLIANVFNFVADWVLMFGDEGLVKLGCPALGLPALGVAGIGLATTLATLLSMAIFFWAAERTGRVPLSAHVQRDEHVRPVYLPHPRVIRRVLTLGLPIGLHMLAEVGIFTFAGLLAGRLGAVAMAAHQVALQLASLTFMVPLGVSSATSVRVGRAVGAGDARRARRAGLAGIGIGAGFMSLSALSMWCFADTYAALMSSDPAVIPLASELILIAGAFQLFDGIQVVSAGALRGAGLTRWTMMANLIAYWVIALPLVLTLGFGMSLGPRGIWWGLTMGLAVAAALLATKFAVASKGPIARLDMA